MLLMAAAALISGCIAPSPPCDRPYSLVGGACCLDSEGDGICDQNAPTTAQPPVTSSTSAPATTSSSSSSTSSTIVATTSTAPPASPEPACHASSDCGAETNSSLGCDGGEVVGQKVKPFCYSPGTLQAECRLRVEKAVFDHCDGEYCFAGRCYPPTCNNRELDYNELDVDCGGACPSCDAVKSRTCVWDAQCGVDYYLEGYVCYNGDVIRQKRVFACLPNRTCMSSVTRVIFDSCMQGQTCVSGEDRCKAADRIIVRREQLGTCHDCKRNQDEDGTDCGGTCLPCAPEPKNETYDLSEEIDLANPLRVVPFRGFEFRFLRPSVEDTCTYGAVLRVRERNGSYAEVEVSRYRNGGMENMVAGFRNGNDTSARIWAYVAGD
jgi:hypothetical protein